MERHGTDVVKALTRFAQMNGYKFEIKAFDKDPLTEEKFVAIAPKLMFSYFNGVDVEGEERYNITIHPDIYVTSIIFDKEISKINDATYVIVGLGNDDVNINTAVNLRMYFERLKIHPKSKQSNTNFGKRKLWKISRIIEVRNTTSSLSEI